jgi:hypothetical protein
LPQPDGPMMAVIEQEGKAMDTDFTAWKLP